MGGAWVMGCHGYGFYLFGLNLIKHSKFPIDPVPCGIQYLKTISHHFISYFPWSSTCSLYIQRLTLLYKATVVHIYCMTILGQSSLLYTIIVATCTQFFSQIYALSCMQTDIAHEVEHAGFICFKLSHIHCCHNPCFIATEHSCPFTGIIQSVFLTEGEAQQR